MVLGLSGFTGVDRNHVRDIGGEHLDYKAVEVEQEKGITTTIGIVVSILGTVAAQVARHQRHRSEGFRGQHRAPGVSGTRPLL